MRLGVFSGTDAKFALRVPELLNIVFHDMVLQTPPDLAYSLQTSPDLAHSLLVSFRIAPPFNIVYYSG